MYEAASRFHHSLGTLAMLKPFRSRNSPDGSLDPKAKRPASHQKSNAGAAISSFGRRIPMHAFLVLYLVANGGPLSAGDFCPISGQGGTPAIAEHPSGAFSSSRDAMTAAFERIRECDNPDRWVVLSGQGQGDHRDSYMFADILFRKHTFDLGESVPGLPDILAEVGLRDRRVEISEDNRIIALPDASPEELAALLNALYLRHFDLKPHEGESDFAFGAEWR